MGQQIIKEISLNELLNETLRIKNEGYRMVAITCANKETVELTYSFDKGYDLLSLRCIIGAEDEVESISSIYSFAFLYENEIKELFGVNVKNISLDFNNEFYKIPVKTPFGTKKGDE